MGTNQLGIGYSGGAFPGNDESSKYDSRGQAQTIRGRICGTTSTDANWNISDGAVPRRGRRGQIRYQTTYNAVTTRRSRREIALVSLMNHRITASKSVQMGTERARYKRPDGRDRERIDLKIII